MIPQPALSDDSVSVPAFAQRVALSVLALEIDELLHRSGADALAPPRASPADPALFSPSSLHPQTTPSS